MAERRLSKTLGNLALALINATLILIALCLFLAWQVLSGFQHISEEFAETLLEMAPVRDDIQALTTEARDLRGDLQALQLRPLADGNAPLAQQQEQLAAFQARMEGTLDRVDAMISQPETLIYGAIDHTAQRATESVSDIVGCTRPDTSG
jgi:hypothetical protein